MAAALRRTSGLRVLDLADVATLSPPSGRCELVMNEQHLDAVVRRALKTVRVSLDIMTADLKAMLIPEGRGRNAKSIIDAFYKLASKGIEVRVLHGGVPSSAALQELKKIDAAGWPESLSLRRCPRVHTKAIIVDASSMYLGSANLTGAGLGAKSPGRRNFEQGIWTEAAPMVDATLGQFNALWEGHECESCRRRDVCPEPLEEFRR